MRSALSGRTRSGAETVLTFASGPLPDDDTLQNALGPIDGSLVFFEVEDPRTTLDTTLAGLNASLIHVVGSATHWSYSPGTKPQPVPGILPDVLSASEGAEVIGVVDTGIMPQTPAWLIDSVRYLPGFDEEVFGANGPAASHGTFIAGLLRQLACEYRVSMARLQLVNHETVVVPEGYPLISDVTTELHLFFSIVRLVQRHEGQLAALNLSLGTYTADDRASLIMSMAIDYWLNNTGEAPIFAAAGNEYEHPGDPYSPFFPAALDPVIGVAAADETGTEVVWDYHQPTMPSKEAAPTGLDHRPWVNRASPGTNLISLGGAPSGLNGLSSLVSWSGSSFAAPVALAMELRGISVDTSHGDVLGLAYETISGATRTPWPNSPCAVSPQGIQQGPTN